MGLEKVRRASRMSGPQQRLCEECQKFDAFRLRDASVSECRLPVGLRELFDWLLQHCRPWQRVQSAELGKDFGRGGRGPLEEAGQCPFPIPCTDQLVDQESR